MKTVAIFESWYRGVAQICVTCEQYRTKMQPVSGQFIKFTYDIITVVYIVNGCCMLNVQHV